MSTSTSQPKTQNHPPKIPTPTFPLYPGELNLLIAHPGTGKSLLALDLAARAAAGSLPPPHPASDKYPPSESDPFRSPGSVIILSAENQHLPFHLHAFGIPPDAAPFPDPHDASFAPEIYATRRYRSIHRTATASPFLRWLKDQNFHNLRLLVLDPLPAFIGPITASASTILDQLRPLLRIAADHRFAILGISHITKSKRLAAPSDLVHLPIGSLAYTALTRSILLLTHDDRPNSELTTQNSELPAPYHSELTTQNSELRPHSRLLFPIKNNCAPLDAAYAFSFQPRPPLEPPLPPDENLPILPPNASPHQVHEYRRIQARYSRFEQHARAWEQSTAYHLPLPPSLEWEPTPILHHPLLRNGLPAPNTSPSPKSRAAHDLAQIEQSKLALALEFLHITLQDAPLPVKTVYHLARDLHLSPRTLDRARAHLKMRPYHSQHTWFLPQIVSPSIDPSGQLEEHGTKELEVA